MQATTTTTSRAPPGAAPAAHRPHAPAHARSQPQPSRPSAWPAAAAPPAPSPPHRRAAATNAAAAGVAAGLSPTYVTPEARSALFSRAPEHVQEVEAEVAGTIPDWLQGALVTNGAGDFTGMAHLFDGLAMLTKLRVAGGRVWASQRYLDSQQHRSKARTGKLKWREFCTPVPAETSWDKAANILSTLSGLVTHSGFTDNGSVNAIPLGDGSVLATSETATSAYRVNPSDLTTLGQATSFFTDGLPGDLITAHPKLLRDGRTLVNFSRTIPAGGFHVFTQDTKTLARKQIAFIRDQDPASPAWVHDMAYTGNHIVICEMPLFFNLPGLIFGEEQPGQFAGMDWRPERGSRIHVVPLDGSAHKTFLAPPFFTFHLAGGFEREGQLHVHLAGYDGPQCVLDLSLDKLRAFPGTEYSKSTLRRLTIPLGAPTGSAIEAPQTISSQPQQYGELCDFPAINPNFRGRPYRYVYCLAAARPTNFGNALAKHDTHTGEARLWYEQGGTTGECTFVPRPGGVDEEDGVVLCQHMGADGRTSLVVLDARSWREVGRARLPYGLPYRFHGAWLPAGGA